jgi:hypothetical protein
MGVPYSVQHHAFGVAAALGKVLIDNSNRRRQKRSVDENEDQAVAGLTLVVAYECIDFYRASAYTC